MTNITFSAEPSSLFITGLYGHCHDRNISCDKLKQHLQSRFKIVMKDGYKDGVAGYRINQRNYEPRILCKKIRQAVIQFETTLRDSRICRHCNSPFVQRKDTHTHCLACGMAHD